MPSPSSLRFATTDTYDRFVAAARRDGIPARGHHNLNYTLPLSRSMARLLEQDAGTRVIVRERRHQALPVVIRTWQDEPAIVRALKGGPSHAPECLYRRGGTAVYSYVDGVPLSSVCQNGKPVDTHLIAALARLLADMTKVRRDALPPLPACWPRSGKDSTAFLRTLVLQAERQIRRPNWRVFGGLFAALGIPEDAMTRYAEERVPVLTRRPHSLLHTDLHRDNVIIPYGGEPPLVSVDWELAGYGDPVHDLATHLVRMRYPADQWDEVICAWAQVMEETRPAATKGLHRDLRHYVDFERAQSVYPDVMRAANELEDPRDQKSLDKAVKAVRLALEAAAEPLHLSELPVDLEIERVLFRWWASGVGPHADRVRRPTPIAWEPDERVPARSDFPRSAVLKALIGEGAAPASRVFKGATHLNTVVNVEGIGFPVVVRRKATSATRREHGFLDEHAVLKAIEEASGVRAPRALALGTSNLKDQFTIHSYEGPATGDKPPRHPVLGLRPKEASDLVAQLVALTSIDCEGIDGAFDPGDFYAWLCKDLARLVSELPPESRALARELGLPTSERLLEILGRVSATPRQAALLHGDLNPWNIVRGDGDAGLSLIDWEMALIGDPLYDLVRHIHLTPTSPEIRERMYDLWSSRLPEECTTGWERDRRLYRNIELVRSAYVDLDRLVTGAGLDAPNVQRAVGSYKMTLDGAMSSLGLPPQSTKNPYLVRALPHGDYGRFRTGGYGISV